MNLNQALNGIAPGATEWAGSSIYDTWYREQGDWCAIVYPDEREHWPGWSVDVWLHHKGPNEPGNLLTTEHVTSGSRLERTAQSRVNALRLADSMLASRGPGTQDAKGR